MLPTTLTAANDEVLVECELDAAPERVWRALSDPQLLSVWLLPNSAHELGPGTRFTFFGSGAGLSDRIACEVLEADPPHRLRYHWREADDTATVVTFELAPRDGGRTLLRVSQFAAATVARRAANGNVPLALAA